MRAAIPGGGPTSPKRTAALQTTAQPHQHQETTVGMYTSAYLAYGIRITDTDSNQLESALAPLATRQKGDDHVGYLHAGKYDDDRTYLVTKCEEASLGQARQVHPDQATAEQYGDWNHNLGEALNALGITDAPEPAWLVIPNVD